jgi:hypothetical protein
LESVIHRSPSLAVVTLHHIPQSKTAVSLLFIWRFLRILEHLKNWTINKQNQTIHSS